MFLYLHIEWTVAICSLESIFERHIPCVCQLALDMMEEESKQ